MITTDGLTKRYGAVLAVDQVGLRVGEGDRYGLIGPNGAGKSTLLRLLLGLVYATSGEIELLGRPVPKRLAEVLPHVGGLVEGPAAYNHLSGRDNLKLLDAAGPGGGRRTRRARIAEALDRVGLAGIDNRPVKAYSLGMRQRLGLACALLRTPRMLILDEPTNGLDAQGIHELRAMFVELVHEGTTIVLSSHLLAEVELICTRAAMMSNGRVVAQDDVASLLSNTGWVRVATPDLDLAVRTLQDGPFGHEVVDGETLRIRLGDRPSELLNKALVQSGVRVRELVVERRTLEDVFLERTGSSDIH